MGTKRRHRRRSQKGGKHRNGRKGLVGNSVSLVKRTSHKYMPKVKHGLENVGSKVVSTGEPFFTSLTRKLRNLF